MRPPEDHRRRLRALVLIDALGHGGAEALLGDFLRAAPAARINVSIAYLRDVDGSPAAVPLREAGAHPVLVPMSRLLDPSGLWRVRRHIAAVRPDVVHTHLDYADVLGAPAARSLGIPCVSTLHVMEWAEGGTAALKARLFAAVRRRWAARVITVSDAARQAYLRCGWDTAGHVVTIHNGIAREPARGSGRQVRAALGLDPADVVAGMVSVLRAGKGHDVAIDAVLALRSRFPRLRLLIAGDGPLRARLFARVRDAGDGVVLAGHRRDVMAILDAVDILLQPSEVDAFPTALLEAMLARVPVIASAVGGIPEIVVPDRTGLLVPAPPRVDAVAAALAALAADPSRRARMGEAGRIRCATEFGAEHWGARLRAIYDQALARS
jgi:glycosyltransferase involved in cell wall biosynthesis